MLYVSFICPSKQQTAVAIARLTQQMELVMIGDAGNEIEDAMVDTSKVVTA